MGKRKKSKRAGENSSRYFLNKLEIKSNQQRLAGTRFAPFDVIYKRVLYLSSDWFVRSVVYVCCRPPYMYCIGCCRDKGFF